MLVAYIMRDECLTKVYLLIVTMETEAKMVRLGLTCLYNLIPM